MCHSGFTAGAELRHLRRACSTGMWGRRFGLEGKCFALRCAEISMVKKPRVPVQSG